MLLYRLFVKRDDLLADATKPSRSASPRARPLSFKKNERLAGARHLIAAALVALAASCGGASDEGLFCTDGGTDGGVCIDTGQRCSPACGANAYCDDTAACQCKDGYTGDPLAGCALPESCAGGACQNGGTCNEAGGGSTCSCVGGYSGPHCETPPASHCLLQYNLQASMLIRDTTAGMGDFNIPSDALPSPAPVMAGHLIVRLPVQDAQVASGTAEILYYDLHQVFATEVSALGSLVVSTDVWAYSPEPRGATDNTTALATGTLTVGTAGAVHLLSFPDCTLPTGYNDTTESYTPDVVATGKGCLSPYRSVGTVNCADDSTLASCGDGNLADGDNPQDETWEQPLPNIELSNDLSTLAFQSKLGTAAPGYMQIPNRSPSRTYLRWQGTLDVAASTCDDL